MALGFNLGLGLSARMYAAAAQPSFSPIVVTAGNTWTGATSWPSVTGVGTGFTTPPTQSNTVNGTGYNQRVIAESSHVYYDYAIDDSYYITFHGGGDYARTGAITWQFWLEDDTPTTYTQVDYQFDPNRKVFGLALAPRPRAGFSGVARWYAKCIPENGMERLLTGEIWFNRIATTGYYDRHANAIYVSGVDYNGSDSIGFAGVGTNDSTVGTSGNPNYRVQRAVQFAFGAKEGCYIYVKGAVVDDTNGASRPTTTVPCRIMPWPGAATNQCKWGKTSRATVGPSAGEINTNINKYEVFGITIDSDTIVKFQGNANTVMGFRSCVFLSTLSVNLDIWGYPIGLQNTVGTGNSQSWATNSNGERNYLIDCTGDIYCAAGFQKVVGNNMRFAWDVHYFGSIAAGMNNFGFIGNKFSGPDMAYARFHEVEQMTVATVVWDAVNGWTKITFSGTPNIAGNLFENYLQILTGTLGGTPRYGNVETTAGWPGGPTTGTVAIRATATIGSPTFPDTNTVYVKGVDLGALGLAAGDLVRVYNHPHKDTGQFTGTTQSHVFFENILYHGNIYVSKDAQWFLNQVGTFLGTGTVTITGGTTATFSSSQTFQTGHFIRINSNQNYAMITAGGTGTVFTLDRAITNIAGATFGIANSIKDILVENCVFDTTDTTNDYKGQWQVGAINVNIMHSTFYGHGTTNGYTVFRNEVANAGFGLTDWTNRNNLFIAMAGDGSSFPASGGYIIDRNHFIEGTARGTNTTTGAPAFAATGSVTSSYYPNAAAVGTCAAVYLPYDRLGNVRSAGAKVGAAAA